MDSEVIGPLAGLGGAVLGFIGGQVNGHREAKSKREALEADLEKTRLELDEGRKDREAAEKGAERAAAAQEQGKKDEVKADLAKAIEDVISGIQADLLSAHLESKARDATSAVKGSSKFDEDSNVKKAARKLDEALADKSVKREAKAIEARDLLSGGANRRGQKRPGASPGA